MYDIYIKSTDNVLKINNLRKLKGNFGVFYLMNKGRNKQRTVIKMAIFLTILSFKTKFTES